MVQAYSRSNLAASTALTSCLCFLCWLPAHAHAQALMSEVQQLRAQVQQLADLLHTAVPSLPPSPGTHSISSEQ